MTTQESVDLKTQAELPRRPQPLGSPPCAARQVAGKGACLPPSKTVPRTRLVDRTRDYFRNTRATTRAGRRQQGGHNRHPDGHRQQASLISQTPRASEHHVSLPSETAPLQNCRTWVWTAPTSAPAKSAAGPLGRRPTAGPVF